MDCSVLDNYQVEKNKQPLGKLYKTQRLKIIGSPKLEIEKKKNKNKTKHANKKNKNKSSYYLENKLFFFQDNL